MKYFTASANIKAPKETIWKIITDAPNYPTWDPGVIRIEGTIASGNKITAYSKISPNRGFPVTVSEFKRGERMAWSSGMPFGLFSGVRTFTLTPRPDGSIDFTLREQFDGALLPIFGRSIPDLTATFEDFVKGLKAYAERQ